MSSSGSDKESLSEVQNQLQGVLVSVKVQEPDKVASNEKRVRFNSLVEVRFIPKVKAKKDKNKDDKEKRKTEEKGNCDFVPEGKENVAIGNQDEPRNDTKTESRNDSFTDKKKLKEKTTVKTNPESTETGENTAVKEGFYLPKVTIGQEYEGDVTRTTKVTAKPQPRNAIRLLKRGSKDSRMHDLNAKAVVHLERQASEYYREADRLFEETVSPHDKKEGSSSPQKCENQSETISPQNQNFVNSALQRCKSVPDFYRRTSLPEMKRSEQNSDGSHKKLSTSLPYINMIPTLTGKLPETNQKDSYTKLYLPQLQRKAEEIKRLNDTVLRKKPKYSPDRSPTFVPNDPTSPEFNTDKSTEKMASPPASSHSIVRYSHGLDIARLLNVTNSAQLFY